MGSILSAIDDDQDEYEKLCDRFNEEPVGLYSLHHKMLEEAARDCYHNIPEAKHWERIQRFKKEYKKAFEDGVADYKRRKQRFKELHASMTADDLKILEEGLDEGWSKS